MRSLLFIALFAGVLWWFTPQSARDRAAEIGRAGTARGVDIVAEYREPVWEWLKEATTAAREKGMALFRNQLHRAVDENVQ